MPKFGCLALLLVIAALSVELWVVLLAIGWTKDILGPLLAVAATSILGAVVIRRHVAGLPKSMLDGTIGRRLIGIIGGILLAFPGFVSDVPGLLLILPPVQMLLGRLGAAIAASVAKRTMSRMFGGGVMPGGFPGGGFPGGFPGSGMPGGIPPGMFPKGFPGLTPDERLPFGKPGAAPKTYDVKPEQPEH